MAREFWSSALVRFGVSETVGGLGYFGWSVQAENESKWLLDLSKIVNVLLIN